MEAMKEKGLINLKVNGQHYSVMVRPADTLLYALREQLGFTGAKPACMNGDCGACTVLVDGWPVKACLMLAVEGVSHDITTVEGLEHPPIQRAFLKHFAFQCGYCTPGFLINCHGLASIHPSPGQGVVSEWLHSNLCRCTGYEEISQAINEVLEGQGI